MTKDWRIGTRVVAIALFLCSAACPAHAQEQRERSPQVALFGEPPNSAKVPGGPALVRLAKEQITAALVLSRRYTFVPQEEIERAEEELGICPPYRKSWPYDKTPLRRLAESLQVDAILTVEIAFVRLDKQGCSLGLYLWGMEPESGYNVQEEVGLGEVHIARKRGDVPTLTREALTRAVAQAVQSFGVRWDKGVILSRTGDTFRMDLGTRDQMRKDLSVWVYRDRKQIGRGQVTAAYLTESEVRITDSTKSIQPNDVVRFILPVGDRSRMSGRKK